MQTFENKVDEVEFESTAANESPHAADTSNPWQTLSSVSVYDNAWIGVREDRVVRPDGNEGIYGVVHFKNTAVGILAIEDDHIFLVGQHRYPLDFYSWEIPEGGCPDGEDTLRAARRELEEETGLRAAHWEFLGEAYLSNSVSDERAVWYLATGLTAGASAPEGTERLSVRRVPFAEALRLARVGEITDALTLLAITGYALRNKEAEIVG